MSRQGSGSLPHKSLDDHSSSGNLSRGYDRVGCSINSFSVLLGLWPGPLGVNFPCCCWAYVWDRLDYVLCHGINAEYVKNRNVFEPDVL